MAVMPSRIFALRWMPWTEAKQGRPLGRPAGISAPGIRLEGRGPEGSEALNLPATKQTSENQQPLQEAPRGERPVAEAAAERAAKAPGAAGSLRSLQPASKNLERSEGRCPRSRRSGRLWLGAGRVAG